MSDMGSHNFPAAKPVPAVEPVPHAAPAQAETPKRSEGHKIGEVIEIAGSGSRIIIDCQVLASLSGHADPTVKMAGQVGSQVKIRVGQAWLLANIRTQKLHEGQSGIIIAAVDFLGEGDEERLTGHIYNFRRGVTRYPVPGSAVYAVTTADLKQVYASDGRANVEIGTVYPTEDIRGALYVDPMLGKHFALLGSTGTGKSTTAALILHKICDLAPDGHIIMIDPHGEYSAAFKNNG
ncbi:Bll3818 protein, partial [hydrothermal vent metagenome]